MRSGFVTLVGRPNVGKSTLLNTILGQKVTIVSDKPQTTRAQVRGVLNLPSSDAPSADAPSADAPSADAQIVFVDTPGIHRPRTLLGERLNALATSALVEVDVVCLVLDATAPIGPGDRFIAARVPADTVVLVNKVDIADRAQVVGQLDEASRLSFSGSEPSPSELSGSEQRTVDSAEYFPVSALTGAGVDELVEQLVDRLPDGPAYYPEGMVTDVPEAFWVAELVREQLLAVVRDELPHSIATRVTEWEWPRIRVEILVERDSQKGIVIGKGGAVLKQVGTAVRSQLPEGVYIELHVKVDKDWQRRPRAIERIGY